MIFSRSSILRSSMMACAALAVAALTGFAAGQEKTTAPTAAAKAPPATAPESKPRTDLPKPDDIVNASFEAMGGKKAFEDLKSTSIKANMTTPMGEITMDMKSAKPASFLMMQSMPGMGESSMGSDGKIGWSNNPAMGGYTLLEDEQLEQIRKQSNMFRMVFNLHEDFPTMETVDQVKFADMDTYKVKMSPKDPEMPTQFAFFGVADKLMHGLEINQEGGGNATITFTDWKKIDGLNLFSKLNIEQSGMQMGMTFTEIEFNKVDSAVFTAPAEVQELAKKKADEAAAKPAGPATAPATTKPGSH